MQTDIVYSENLFTVDLCFHVPNPVNPHKTRKTMSGTVKLVFLCTILLNNSRLKPFAFVLNHQSLHAPRTEHVLYHLAHKTPDVLAGRWVVEEHAVLDQRIVRLRDPAGIILVQMHPEDVHTHLPDDNQTSDNKKWREPFPPVSCPSLSGPNL